MKIVGDCIGLDLVLRVEREERTQWRNELVAQYQEKHGGKFPKSLKNWTKRYEKIAEIIKPKLKEPNFVPTYEERRFLDTLPDVCRVTKKNLVSRAVVDVYRHYSLLTNTNGDFSPSNSVTEDPNSLKEASFIRSRPSSANFDFPINFIFRLIEEVVKPLSLSLRLFGNMFASEIVFILIAITPWYAHVTLGLMWSILHILVITIQAFVFMMLTIVYMSMAAESH